jgi:hypothetical protein
MAKKKIISVSLSSDVIKIVEDFQKEKDLNSFSASIERIVLESKKTDVELVKDIVYKILGEKGIKNQAISTNSTEKDGTITAAVNNAIDDIFNNIPINND